MSKACRPWIVQVRQYGCTYCFETEAEANIFISSFESVAYGPVYDEEEGIVNERLCLGMVIIIVENERNKRNS